VKKELSWQIFLPKLLITIYNLKNQVALLSRDHSSFIIISLFQVFEAFLLKTSKFLATSGVNMLVLNPAVNLK